MRTIMHGEIYAAFTLHENKKEGYKNMVVIAEIKPSRKDCYDSSLCYFLK